MFTTLMFRLPRSTSPKYVRLTSHGELGLRLQIATAFLQSSKVLFRGFCVAAGRDVGGGSAAVISIQVLCLPSRDDTARIRHGLTGCSCGRGIFVISVQCNLRVF